MQKKKVLVIGLGRFGSSVVTALWPTNLETIAVDTDPVAVDAIKAKADAAFLGDATDPTVLRGIGAAECDVAVVTFGEDFESSVLCVAELRRLGVREIVARAANETRAGVLRAVGATSVVQIEHEMGRRVAADLVSPIAADLLEFAHAQHVHPWTARGPLVGRSLAEAELRKRFGITALGYNRPGPQTKAGARKFDVATASYVITEGDVLLLVGETSAIQAFVTEMGG